MAEAEKRQLLPSAGDTVEKSQSLNDDGDREENLPITPKTEHHFNIRGGRSFTVSLFNSFHDVFLQVADGPAPIYWMETTTSSRHLHF